MSGSVRLSKPRASALRGRRMNGVLVVMATLVVLDGLSPSLAQAQKFINFNTTGSVTSTLVFTNQIVPDVYSFFATAGERIRVQTSNNSFDTTIRVIGPDAAINLFDDDGGLQFQREPWWRELYAQFCPRFFCSSSCQCIEQGGGPGAWRIYARCRQPGGGENAQVNQPYRDEVLPHGVQLRQAGRLARLGQRLIRLPHQDERPHGLALHLLPTLVVMETILTQRLCRQFSLDQGNCPFMTS